MEKLRKRISACRFDNYIFGYATLYFFMVAPPRSFKIKARQQKTQGELANLPIYIIMAIELVVRFAIILLIAASIESLIGNTLYETNRIDVFFGVVMAIGTLHSITFYLIFSSAVLSSTLTFFYRLIRNTCYALLSGFIPVIPVLILKWAHQLPPFEGGIALQLYSWTAAFFLLVGIIEAKIMVRMPLGTHLINSSRNLNNTPKNLHTEMSSL
jgi:hypothetical protein